MGLESATYIADLVSTNPAGSDQKLQGDDHIRLVKAVLKATFPGADHAIAAGALPSTIVAKSSNYTVVAADAGKLFDASSTFTLALTAAATLGSSFGFWVYNSGTGVVTIDPNSSELINGATTLALKPGGFLGIRCDGSKFYALHAGSPDFTQAVAIALATAGTNLTLSTSDAGATGVALRSFHDSANPAANDTIFALNVDGRDSAGNVQGYGQLTVTISSPTNTAEGATWQITIPSGGSTINGISVAADGVQIGSPTGGNKGAGILNAQGLYQNGQVVAQDIATVISGTTHSPSVGDHGKTFIYTSGSAVTITVPAASGLFDGWWINVVKQGAGALSFNRSGSDNLISKGTSLTTLYMGGVGDGGRIICDKTNTRFFFHGRRSNSPADFGAAVSTDTAAAHLLGVEPDSIKVQLVCTTNNLNYVAATPDIVTLGVPQINAGGGFVYLADATNINFKTANAAIAIPNKTTYAVAAITAGSWSYRLTAYAFN